MPSTLRASSKRQTKLVLTPLPSSSPVSTKQPAQFQERVANVRYEDPSSPLKKRRVQNASGSGDLCTGTLPTPMASSQLNQAEGNQESADAPSSDILASSPYTPTKRKNHNIPLGQRGSSIFRSSSSPRRNSSLKRVAPSDTSSPSDSEHVELFLSPPAQKQKDTESQFTVAAGPSSEEDVPLRGRRARSSNRKAVVVSSDEDVDEKMVPVTPPNAAVLAKAATVTPQSGRQQPSSSRRNSLRFIMGGSSGYAPISSSRVVNTGTPKKSRKSQTSPFTRRVTRSNRAKSRSLPQVRSTRPSHRVIDLSSGSDSPSETQPSTRRRTRGSPKSESTCVVSGSDEPMTPRPQTQRRGRSNVRKASDSESADKSDIVTPAMRRRLMRRNTSSSRDSVGSARKQAEVDIDDDLEDLQDTEVRTDRTRGGIVDSKKLKTQAQLEILKQRRASIRLVDIASEEETDTTHVDEGDDDAISDLTHDEDAESNLDDFLSGDDGVPFGAPTGLHEMPLEFTRHAHKTPKEYFKHVVEWMVHNKLNPAFQREDPLYRMADDKLDDLVQGFAGSKFLSAAWTPDFSEAIKARPVLDAIERRSNPFDSGCQACKRTSHPATFRIEFSGKAYNPRTLDEIWDDEKCGGDEDGKDEGEEGDSCESIPIVEKQFLVGKYCKQNAVIGHKLLHWRWHLNDWVLDWLKDEGYTKPDKVIERENWSTKKRTKYANKVVDEMETSGEIENLHRDFKRTLDEARDYKPYRPSNR